MRGYRAEEWTPSQIEKAFKLPLRKDFYFKILNKQPLLDETIVATSLPVCLWDASLPGPDHKDRLSNLAGAFKRLGAQVPLCSFQDMCRIVEYNRKFLYPIFNTFTSDQILDTLVWIDSINHPEDRKAELRKANELLLDRGLFNRPGIDEDNPTLAKSFIKDEKYEEEKPNRWINSSLDIVKVAFGPIADRIMEELVKCESMIKTVPVADRAKAIWTDLGGEGIVAQSSDATAMEDHYANINDPNAPILNDPRYRIFNDFAMYLCGDLKVTTQQMHTVKFLFFRTPGVSKAALTRHWTTIRDSETLKQFFINITDTYRKLDMRDFGYVLINAILCSGEMNTSSKNTFSMFSMSNFAAYDLSNGKTTRVPTKNEGDDSLAVYKKGENPDELWWARFGWCVKVEFVGFVNEASFCGLVFAPYVYDSVPDIRKTICKFGWTNRKYCRASRPCLMSLLRSKALSMACEYNNVPILGALAQRLLFLTKHVHIRDSVIWSLDLYERTKLQMYIKQKPWMNTPNVHIETRKLVANLQNISISVQKLCEEHVSNIEIDHFFTLPWLDFTSSSTFNMTRCDINIRRPRMLLLDGRKQLCDAMESMVQQLLWPVKKKEQMLRCLFRLSKGSN